MAPTRFLKALRDAFPQFSQTNRDGTPMQQARPYLHCSPLDCLAAPPVARPGRRCRRCCRRHLCGAAAAIDRSDAAAAAPLRLRRRLRRILLLRGVRAYSLW